ncbi:hypothetical protein [Dokdonella sp.]
MTPPGGLAPPAPSREIHMFKYVIAWLLGVPAGLLVLIYVFTHLF